MYFHVVLLAIWLWPTHAFATSKAEQQTVQRPPADIVDEKIQLLETSERSKSRVYAEVLDELREEWVEKPPKSRRFVPAVLPFLEKLALEMYNPDNESTIRVTDLGIISGNDTKEFQELKKAFSDRANVHWDLLQYLPTRMGVEYFEHIADRFFEEGFCQDAYDLYTTLENISSTLDKFQGGPSQDIKKTENLKARRKLTKTQCKRAKALAQVQDIFKALTLLNLINLGETPCSDEETFANRIVTFEKKESNVVVPIKSSLNMGSITLGAAWGVRDQRRVLKIYVMDNASREIHIKQIMDPFKIWQEWDTSTIFPYTYEGTSLSSVNYLSRKATMNPRFEFRNGSVYFYINEKIQLRLDSFGNVKEAGDLASASEKRVFLLRFYDMVQSNLHEALIFNHSDEDLLKILAAVNKLEKLEAYLHLPPSQDRIDGIAVLAQEGRLKILGLGPDPDFRGHEPRNIVLAHMTQLPFDTVIKIYRQYGKTIQIPFSNYLEASDPLFFLESKKPFLKIKDLAFELTLTNPYLALDIYVYFKSIKLRLSQKEFHRMNVGLAKQMQEHGLTQLDHFNHFNHFDHWIHVLTFLKSHKKIEPILADPILNCLKFCNLAKDVDNLMNLVFEAPGDGFLNQTAKNIITELPIDVDRFTQWLKRGELVVSDFESTWIKTILETSRQTKKITPLAYEILATLNAFDYKKLSQKLREDKTIKKDELEQITSAEILANAVFKLSSPTKPLSTQDFVAAMAVLRSYGKDGIDFLKALINTPKTVTSTNLNGVVSGGFTVRNLLLLSVLNEISPQDAIEVFRKNKTIIRQALNDFNIKTLEIEEPHSKLNLKKFLEHFRHSKKGNE